MIGITATEDVGGADLGAYEEAIAMEELAKVNPNLAVSVLVQNVAGSILYEYGDAQHRELARKTIAGECLVAITITEPEAGNDIQNVSTRATQDGNEWVLDGIKSFITLGGDADILVTLAQTDPSAGRHGMRFFAVDRRTPGIQTSQIDTYVNRPAPTFRVMFRQGARPGKLHAQCGFRRNHGRLQSGTYHGGRALAGTYANGIGLGPGVRANPAPVRSPHRRESVHCLRVGSGPSGYRGGPPAHLLRVAERWDSGAPLQDVILDVSTAKLHCTQAVVRVTQTVLHTAGGWGLTSELPAMRWAMDALVAPVTVGSVEIQQRAIARQLNLPVD